jgi:hypothetical protein
MLKSKKDYYCKKNSRESSSGFICGNTFHVGFLADLSAKTRFLGKFMHICSHFQHKIPQKSFLRIPKTVGNYYMGT